jgi:hypothetical protein
LFPEYFYIIYIFRALDAVKPKKDSQFIDSTIISKDSSRYQKTRKFFLINYGYKIEIYYQSLFLEAAIEGKNTIAEIPRILITIFQNYYIVYGMDMNKNT